MSTLSANISIRPNRVLPLGSTPHAWSLPPDTTTAFTGRRFSPLGRLIDRAQDAGVPGDFVDDKSTPYEGYYFRILNAQGPGAPGGAKSYIEAGNMTGGFALIAWPAAFGHPVAVRTHLGG